MTKNIASITLSPKYQERIEKVLESMFERLEQEVNNVESDKLAGKIFGSKCYADVLVTIISLMQELARMRLQSGEMSPDSVLLGAGVSEADVALVNRFVTRVRKHEQGA